MNCSSVGQGPGGRRVDVVQDVLQGVLAVRQQEVIGRQANHHFLVVSNPDVGVSYLLLVEFRPQLVLEIITELLDKIQGLVPVADLEHGDPFNQVPVGVYIQNRERCVGPQPGSNVVQGMNACLILNLVQQVILLVEKVAGPEQIAHLDGPCRSAPDRV